MVIATLLVLTYGVALSSAYEPTGGGTTSTGTGTAGGSEPPSGGGPVPSGHKGHKAAASKSAKGTIASVDATAKSFVVHPAKGDDVTLKVNDKTKYTPKGRTWDDVKADAKVTVTYHNDGTDNWARTVHFAAEKAAKTAPKTGRR